jgi:signal transduction histidine kinase
VGEIPLASIDHHRIAQVITNLVGNSIKFTPQKGKITLFIKRKGSNVEVSVTDTGPGISEDDQKRIFTRNWQARGTAQMGAGLGLYISQGIIRAHGGQIWLESRPGHGATFSFTVPVSEKSGEGSAEMGKRVS